MRNEPSAPTLWLQIRSEHASHVFELSASNDRAIVVGSLLRADIRIDEPGIAPVHFQFERDGYLVRLVPVYGAVLHVEGLPVRTPYAIRQQALIQFRTHRMYVAVLDHPPRAFSATADRLGYPTTPDEDVNEYDDQTIPLIRLLDAEPCHPALHSSQIVSRLQDHVAAQGMPRAPAGARLVPCTRCGGVEVQLTRGTLHARCVAFDAATEPEIPSASQRPSRGTPAFLLAMVLLGIAMAALALWFRERQLNLP